MNRNPSFSPAKPHIWINEDEDITDMFQVPGNFSPVLYAPPAPTLHGNADLSGASEFGAAGPLVQVENSRGANIIDRERETFRAAVTNEKKKSGKKKKNKKQKKMNRTESNDSMRLLIFAVKCFGAIYLIGGWGEARMMIAGLFCIIVSWELQARLSVK